MNSRNTSVVIAISAWVLGMAFTISGQQSATELAKSSKSSNPTIVTIVGAVHSPSRFELRRQVRVSELLELACVRRDAKTSEIMIIRRTPIDSMMHAIQVDRKRISKHRAEDLVLEADDIVIVPDKKNRGDCFSCPFDFLTNLNQLPLRIVE